MNPFPLQTEIEIWQLALEHFGSVRLVQLLEQGAERFTRHKAFGSDVYRPFPARMFSNAVVALVQQSRIPQLELSVDHLLVPQALRRFLSAELLQALPIERLSSVLRELRLALDLGI